ncbi:dip2/utp12 domain and wd-repeat protein [Dermatophagoides farinae]|uniref:Dip2/utp12 domain and wd-repeat protein n=1 Tax=Dermatophagoides farinae TaxID=6954 RepID=A0A9D4P3P5_DERFA|nr:dip2/utp12 domain and wd-repeat protein [Dermatophagoides farinae]
MSSVAIRNPIQHLPHSSQSRRFDSVDSDGKNQVMIASLLGNVILHRKDFKHIGDRINDVQFSPDGKYFAICGSSKVLVYLTPGYIGQGKGRQLSGFKIHKMIQPGHEESVSVAWNHTSQLLLITSKDYSMRIYPIDRKISAFGDHITLTAHNDLIIGAFFSKSKPNPLNMYSISRNGQLFVWDCSWTEIDNDTAADKLNYRIVQKKYLFEDLKEKNSGTRITAYGYEPKARLMVVGYNDGRFMLYDLADMILIHSLQLSNKTPISTVSFNGNGAWIALGTCPGSGNKYDLDNEVSTQTQLIVWEWQSESFILKQSGYSNSVTNSYECVAYSPDASLLITGGTDGRLKVWNLFTGFCVSMFTSEHKGPITGVEFVPGKDGKVFVTCSLDGTVKAFDLNRYRCFRTLAAPSDSKPAQFISLAVDKIGGDFIAAGSHNFFEIFLWSLKTGRLLEMLSGHEAPVSSVKFSPNSNTLYSCSWDCTVRIWNLFEGAKHTREVIKLGSDALWLDIREDGHEFAVATLNGTISFYDAQSGDQLGIGIEQGKQDLGRSRYRGEQVDDKYKYFSTFAYSVDGQYVIAAGRSKYVCIYNVKQKLLVKRFEISNNLSLDGFAEFISKRKMQEFGFDIDRIKHRDDESSFAPVALPGVIKSDYADRQLMPIIAVMQIRFSPTMRSFALASTEGVLHYSVDNTTSFNPYELDTSVTIESYRENLNNKQYAQSLIQALKFNDWNLIQESLENIPADQIGLITSTLSLAMVDKLLGHLDKGFEKTGHFEFYLRWVESLLTQNACAMKSCLSTEQTTALRRLHQTLKSKHQDLSRIVEFTKYNCKFMAIMAKHAHQQPMIADDDNQMDVDL